MPTPYFRQDTLDDLLRASLEAIHANGRRIQARRGPFREITGVMLELTNVRARISRSETRGRVFSALGEFCWYLSGCGDFDTIAYYLPRAYDRAKDVGADGMTITGAYGPRLVDSNGGGQLELVIDSLSRRPTTRQAVLQLFDADDVRSGQHDVPCTCTIQLLNREERLEMVTYMRSNDVYLGLPHDVFCFTLLQEWVARRLGVDVGTYKHVVGSLHLYDEDLENAQRFLDEGFQSTQSPMPPMPTANPEESLAKLLAAETALRAATPDFTSALAHENTLHSYWADLVRLLTAYRNRKDGNDDGVRVVRNRMASEVYHNFLVRRANGTTAN